MKVIIGTEDLIEICFSKICERNSHMKRDNLKLIELTLNEYIDTIVISEIKVNNIPYMFRCTYDKCGDTISISAYKLEGFMEIDVISTEYGYRLRR